MLKIILDAMNQQEKFITEMTPELEVLKAKAEELQSRVNKQVEELVSKNQEPNVLITLDEHRMMMEHHYMRANQT